MTATPTLPKTGATSTSFWFTVAADATAVAGFVTANLASFPTSVRTAATVGAAVLIGVATFIKVWHDKGIKTAVIQAATAAAKDVTAPPTA